MPKKKSDNFLFSAPVRNGLFFEMGADMFEDTVEYVECVNEKRERDGHTHRLAIAITSIRRHNGVDTACKREEATHVNVYLREYAIRMKKETVFH